MEFYNAIPLPDNNIHPKINFNSNYLRKCGFKEIRCRKLGNLVQKKGISMIDCVSSTVPNYEVIAAQLKSCIPYISADAIQTALLIV